MPDLERATWVRPPEPIRGLDHLGVQAPCIALNGQLLPGITNVTDRARYHTFHPRVLWSFEKRYKDHSLDECRPSPAGGNSVEICTEVNRPADALPATGASLGYTRHRPERTVLYAVVRKRAGSWRSLARAGDFCPSGSGAGVNPSPVRWGLRRIAPPPPNPACLGRRMCATANLMECVLPPESGLRQWVLTFAFSWRATLARNGALLGSLTRIFEETVQSFYAHRARQGGHGGAKTGSVAILQRTSFTASTDSAARM